MVYASESSRIPGFRLSGYPAQPIRTVPPVAVLGLDGSAPSVPDGSALGLPWVAVHAPRDSARMARAGRTRWRRIVCMFLRSKSAARRSPGRDGRSNSQEDGIPRGIRSATRIVAWFETYLYPGR